MVRYLWVLLPLLLIPAALLLLGDDTGYFLVWWLAFAVIGWLVWPLAVRIFPDGDSGYLLAKPLGLAISSLLLWTLSYLRVLPFQRWAVTFALCLTGLFFWLFKDGWQLMISIWRDSKKIRRVAAGEFLMGAALLFWTFARGLKPEIDGLEKFMDIGFMNTLWRTDYLPALDMWLSGGHINYYYFGQYVYTFMARLTDIRPEISYNLSMASTFALTFALGYAVISQLIGLLRRHRNSLSSAAQAIGGLIAAFLLTFGGNGHAWFYDLKGPGHGLLVWLNKIGLVGGYTENPFWFADSTRFIGYNPNTPDKTIHEFPYYSFLVADLHAHVINLAFMLLLIALLVRLISDEKLIWAAAGCRSSQEQNQSSTDREWHRAEMRQLVQRFRITAGNLPLLLIIMLLAIAMMGNFWDFAIYFAVTVVVLFLLNRRGYGKFRPAGILIFVVQSILILLPFLLVSQPWLAVMLFGLILLLNQYLTLIFGDTLTLTGAQMSWIFFLAHLVTLPFSSSFEPISKKIALAVDHTPLWQLAILWGPHILAGLILFTAVILLSRRAAGKQWNPADQLAVVLVICGIGLILLPELLYVVDIYSGEYKRANTMFKFTYQAFVLLSLAWAYALVRLSAIAANRGRSGTENSSGRSALQMMRAASRDTVTRRNWPAIVGSLFLAALLLLPAWYPLLATRQWIGTISIDRFAGLDGFIQFASKNSAQIPDDASGELAADYAAIQWLNQNVQGQPIILEAAGESYTDYCRISAFTGLPTVIGWETHEWLWRTSKSNPDAYSTVVWPRQQDVRQIYTTTDQVTRQALLDKYHVSYIVIGDLERSKYSEELSDGTRHSLVQEDLLGQLGTVVFRQENLVILQLALG